MKGVLDSMELRMLRRADYMRERNILGESHVYSYGTPSVLHIGWEIGRADSLLSLAFATRWNPKHPSYVSTRLFCNSISQFSCGEQTIWDVQSYWQVKYQTNTYLRNIYIYIYIYKLIISYINPALYRFVTWIWIYNSIFINVMY